MENDGAPEVNVSVTLPPDIGEPPTDSSSPSPAVIVLPPSGNGDEPALIDAQARIRDLEAEVNDLKAAQQATATLAIATSMAQSEPPPSEPETTELVVPDSSDSGPPSEPEKPPAEAGAQRHRWI